MSYGRNVQTSPHLLLQAELRLNRNSCSDVNLDVQPHPSVSEAQMLERLPTTSQRGKDDAQEDGEVDLVDSMMSGTSTARSTSTAGTDLYQPRTVIPPYRPRARRPRDVLGANLVRGFRSTLEPLPYVSIEPVTPSPSASADSADFERLICECHDSPGPSQSDPIAQFLDLDPSYLLSAPRSKSGDTFHTSSIPSPRANAGDHGQLNSSNWCHVCRKEGELLPCLGKQFGVCHRSICFNCLGLEFQALFALCASVGGVKDWTCSSCSFHCKEIRGRGAAVPSATSNPSQWRKSALKSNVNRSRRFPKRISRS
jgi:hypothetical protein